MVGSGVPEKENTGTCSWAPFTTRLQAPLDLRSGAIATRKAAAPVIAESCNGNIQIQSAPIKVGHFLQAGDPWKFEGVKVAKSKWEI